MAHRPAVVALSLFLTVIAPAGAADSFNRLSARDMAARLPGHMVTDEAHWSDSFTADGMLIALELGQRRPGSWKIENDELCLTRKAKRVVSECFEVWQSKDQIQYRRDGITIMEGVLRHQ
jgi:hypothetical protein